MQISQEATLIITRLRMSLNTGNVLKPSIPCKQDSNDPHSKPVSLSLVTNTWEFNKFHQSYCIIYYKVKQTCFELITYWTLT